MSDLETKPVPQVSNNSEAQCAALQKQVSLLFLCLFICSGTLSIFLWKQNRIARLQFENAQRTVQPTLDLYQREQNAAFKTFEAKLSDWASTHPDFNRFLAAHNIQLQVTPAPAPKK